MIVPAALPDIFSLPSVIFAAHPDDEVIGLGGLLPRMKNNVTVVHVTDGAPGNLHDARAAGFDCGEAYANARRIEVLAALRLAGISEKAQIWLSFGDQQTAFSLAELTLRVADVLRTLRPAVVLTHPYEGGHPDHDSTVFAVQSALQLLFSVGSNGPNLWEFTSYHAGPSEMETSEFIPQSGRTVFTFHLTERERALKRRMFDCFPTQKGILSQFPIAVERIREAPAYRFSDAPQSTRLWYEQFDWGVDGKRWRQLAGEAQQRLGIAR